VTIARAAGGALTEEVVIEVDTSVGDDKVRIHDANQTCKCREDFVLVVADVAFDAREERLVHRVEDNDVLREGPPTILEDE